MGRRSYGRSGARDSGRYHPTLNQGGEHPSQDSARVQPHLFLTVWPDSESLHWDEPGPRRAPKVDSLKPQTQPVNPAPERPENPVEDQHRIQALGPPQKGRLHRHRLTRDL